jgi:hypothetical protein
MLARVEVALSSGVVHSGAELPFCVKKDETVTVTVVWDGSHVTLSLPQQCAAPSSAYRNASAAAAIAATETVWRLECVSGDPVFTHDDQWVTRSGTLTYRLPASVVEGVPQEISATFSEVVTAKGPQAAGIHPIVFVGLRDESVPGHMDVSNSRPLEGFTFTEEIRQVSGSATVTHQWAITTAHHDRQTVTVAIWGFSDNPALGARLVATYRKWQ